MKNSSCLKCNSERIASNVQVLDRNQSFDSQFSLLVYENPDAMLFKGTHTYPLSAHVCRDCGYVEFYVTELTHFDGLMKHLKQP